MQKDHKYVKLQFGLVSWELKWKMKQSLCYYYKNKVFFRANKTFLVHFNFFINVCLKVQFTKVGDKVPKNIPTSHMIVRCHMAAGKKGKAMALKYNSVKATLWVKGQNWSNV